MLYYAACWNTAVLIDRDLRNMESKSSKLLALKYTIKMRVEGLEWEDLSTHWFKSGKAFTLENLTRYHKVSQKDSIKVVVTIHPNQYASVDPCTKFTAATHHASTISC